MNYLWQEIKIATKLADILRKMPFQVRFDHFIDIIATKSDKVEHLYAFHARSPNKVQK